MSRDTKPSTKLDLKKVLSNEDLRAERKRRDEDHGARGHKSARSPRSKDTSSDSNRVRESSREKDKDLDRHHHHHHSSKSHPDRASSRIPRGLEYDHKPRDKTYQHESGSQSHRHYGSSEDSDEERSSVTKSSHTVQVRKPKDRSRALSRANSDHQLDKLAPKRVEEEVDSDDKDYSSEEEVEEEGKKVSRMRRSQSVNREALAEPKVLEGWLTWLSDGRFFKKWKRYYFVLEYPFINFYSAQPAVSIWDRLGQKAKGKLSVRGGCLVDSKMIDSVRNPDHNNRRFRLLTGKKEWIMEAETLEQKAQWVQALREHIEYANPAKREKGVSYKCKVNDQGAPMSLQITLTEMTLTNMSTGKVEWSRTFNKLHKILESTVTTNVLLLDFYQWGGTTKLTFDTVPSKTIHACLAGILATHVAWSSSFPAQV